MDHCQHCADYYMDAVSMFARLRLYFSTMEYAIKAHSYAEAAGEYAD